MRVSREAVARVAVPVAMGCLALAFGFLVYLIDRGPAHSMLMPALADSGGHHVFGAWGQWLPSFVHPFAFSLLTAAILPASAQARYWACAAWCAVNVAFEVGEHPHVSGHLAALAHSAFGHGWLTQALANYFVRGTFDGGDIVAAVAGALVAAGVLCVVQARPENSRAQ